MAIRGRDYRTPECIAFGDALRKLRGETGQMQYEVAAAAKLTRAMVSSYEAGKAYPSVPTLRALLQALGADFCDLQRAMDAGSQAVHFRLKAETVEREVGRAVLAFVDKLRQGESTQRESVEVETIRELAMPAMPSNPEESTCSSMKES